MFLALEVATEAISTQHLKQPEEHAKLQSLAELLLVDLLILLQTLQIDLDEFLAQLFRIACRGLPKETCHIILNRTFPAALEIYEIRILLAIEHDIAGLEVTIHEGTTWDAHNVAGHQLERCLQLQFVEIQTCSLEEAILEVIEVEQDVCLIKCFLGITLGEVKSKGTTYLHGWQRVHCSVHLLHVHLSGHQRGFGCQGRSGGIASHPHSLQ